MGQRVTKGDISGLTKRFKVDHVLMRKKLNRKINILTRKQRTYLLLVSKSSLSKKAFPPPPDALKSEIDAAGGIDNWIKACENRKRFYLSLLTIAKNSPLKK